MNVKSLGRFNPLNVALLAGASNTTPITLTAGGPITGFKDGDTVRVAGVGGNTAANGVFRISGVDVANRTFQLAGSAGNGNYTSGGTVFHCTPLARTPTKCAQIRMQVVAGLTGKIYVGVAATPDALSPAMNSITMAGVIKEFWPNAAGGIGDELQIQSFDDTDTLDLADYAIDVQVAGEGLIVAYWVS